MLKLIFFVLKISLISLTAIFLANFIKIDGSTLSDHVRRIADRSKSTPISRDVQRWAHQITTQPLSRIETPEASEEEVAPEDQSELKSIIRKQSIKSKRR